jgi:hypothetical protein
LGFTAYPDEVDPPFGINRIPGLDPGIGPRVQHLRMKIDCRAKPGNESGQRHSDALWAEQAALAIDAMLCIARDQAYITIASVNPEL